MKNKKRISLVLASLLLATSICGCGGNKDNDGKVSVSIGMWPTETQPEALEKQNKMKDDFMVENPDIEIVPDTYTIDTKTFILKAAAGTLPNLYHTWFTEIDANINAGYAIDITEQVKKHGFDTAINPKLMELCTKDGKIYGIPTAGYVQGLMINKKLFTEAGLVNEDGSVKVPDTFQELAEFAQIVKEKTGKAGFIMPTIENQGGWHFLNIAWAFGADFVKQRDDGSYEAIFNSQEAVDALTYIKDLKWKYNALLDESVIGYNDTRKFFGTYQAAMFFAEPPENSLYQQYGMKIGDLYATKMPAGPAGRFSQTGGSLWMVAKDTTPEQVDAGLRWLKYTGFSPEFTDEQAEKSKQKFEDTLEKGGVVLDRECIDLWVEENSLEKRNAVRAEYVNIDPSDFEDYYGFEGVTIMPEPVAAQQLYSVLDKCIQEVITNENADPAELIATACDDFQKNHLDKM